ncbi:MAG: prepilin-type N-terminal cleavage/methylation domain-containing protein [Verrucomicrobiota bacterium]
MLVPEIPKKQDGYSLVEMVVTLFVFSLLALGLTKTLTFSKMAAEDNLYEATALTVATSVVEQIKGSSYANLEDPIQVSGKDAFEMVGGTGNASELILDEFNTLIVPLVTEADGLISKNMEIRLKPTITPMNTGIGYWIIVEYNYNHPRMNRIRTNYVRNARSNIPSS